MTKNKSTDLLQFASDLDLLSSSLAAGLPLVDATGYLVEHGSTGFRANWQKLFTRLNAELPLHLALHDFKIAAEDFWCDQLCEIIITCEVYKATLVSSEVLKLASLVRQAGEANLESKRRISAATSISWLALASPWLLLAMLISRPENLAVFLQPEGLFIILAGLAASIAAFVISKRISTVAPRNRVFA